MNIKSDKTVKQCPWGKINSIEINDINKSEKMATGQIKNWGLKRSRGKEEAESITINIF